MRKINKEKKEEEEEEEGEQREEQAGKRNNTTPSSPSRHHQWRKTSMFVKSKCPPAVTVWTAYACIETAWSGRAHAVTVWTA